MIRIDGQTLPALRSVASTNSHIAIGDTVRLDHLGGWPQFEVVGQDDDGAFVLRRVGR